MELGYTKLRRYKKTAKRLCVIAQKDNIEYSWSRTTLRMTL